MQEWSLHFGWHLLHKEPHASLSAAGLSQHVHYCALLLRSTEKKYQHSVQSSLLFMDRPFTVLLSSQQKSTWCVAVKCNNEAQLK